MPSRRRLSFAAAWQTVLGALIVAQPACATHELKRAPAEPDKAWTIPEGSDFAGALRASSREYAAGNATAAEHTPPGSASSNGQKSDTKKSDAEPQNRVLLVSGHQYSLPELIDLAQRHNPETRDAWEKARQAAFGVGVAESQYLPELSAQVIGGFQTTPIPVPTSLLPAGFVRFNTREAIPMLAVKWLLFDFGARKGALREAEAKSLIANVTFTEAHEKVIFAVSRDYFALDAARAGVRVAQLAAKNAQRTQDISEAKRAQGVATVVDVAQTRRQTAQAQFDLVKARGAEHTAYSTLVASIGVDPHGLLEVADSGDRPLPAAPMQDVRALVEAALANRPDVAAALGKVRVAEASLESARAAYWPKLEVNAQLYENLGSWSTGEGYFPLREPGANVLLGLKLPLFDGGERVAKVAIARSEVSGARAALDGARDRAALEVTSAYDKLQTSFAEYQAALEVVRTAQTALDGAIEAYQAGVGPLTDALTAENAARESQLQQETARGSVFTSAAALAFALGSATRQ